MHRPPTLVSLAAMAGIALFLSGCGQAANATLAESSPDPAPERLGVVASTSVYGDLARTIGGDRVHVTSIISGTSLDPHSYEPTPQDKLALSKADLAIGNGGGFDPFFDTITKDSGLSQDRIINAFDVAGVEGGEKSHTQGHTTGDAQTEINEHVWYSMSAASRIADEIATRLGAVDPEGAAVFADNAEKFKSDTVAITEKLTVIKTRHSGEGVALTEPLPLYILEAAGLENRTPEDFLEAAEEGSDVPADALKSTVDLVSSTDVRFLAYDAQTSTPQTEAVRKAAEAANLPVVNFTETLPEGKTFVQWMNENADNIESALRR